jgi:hypothetical protein
VVLIAGSWGGGTACEVAVVTDDVSIKKDSRTIPIDALCYIVVNPIPAKGRIMEVEGS